MTKKLVDERPELTQADKFRETARDLGCDESEEAFDAKLKAIASVKPSDTSSVKKKSKKGERNG